MYSLPNGASGSTPPRTPRIVLNWSAPPAKKLVLEVCLVKWSLNNRRYIYRSSASFLWWSAVLALLTCQALKRLPVGFVSGSGFGSHLESKNYLFGAFLFSIRFVDVTAFLLGCARWRQVPVRGRRHLLRLWRRKILFLLLSQSFRFTFESFGLEEKK